MLHVLAFSDSKNRVNYSVFLEKARHPCTVDDGVALKTMKYALE